MFKVDPNRPLDQILSDIESAANHAANIQNPGLAFAPFSALLIKLSREANETADKNILAQERLILLTNKLLWVTAFVLAVSIALLVAAAVPLVR